MKEIVCEDKCFGCSACYNICPKSAITMKENNEGFLIPIIDEKKCVDCGLCKKVCPSINSTLTNKKLTHSIAYKSNDEIRKDSSSGGAFYVLATWFINNGGYVAGAVWNNNIYVEHILSDKIEDIERMRKSKYVQSCIGDCYTQVKKVLDDDKKVLFSGTPCQVAGLKTFLGKEYENLYCIDIICHGVPSPKVFKRYISELLDSSEKWVQTTFRYKENGYGWANKDCKIYTQTDRNEYKFIFGQEAFSKGFLNNVFLRKSCHSCKFATIPRQGDLTLGDFWRIQKFNKSFDDKKGLSLVLNNNKKGDFLLELLKENTVLFKEVPIEYAIKGNPNLERPTKPSPSRKLFFEMYNKKSFKELVELCVDDKCDYLIVNFWDSSYNYGAMLTAYALQEIIKELGYIPKILNTGEKTHYSWYKNSHLEEFANEHLDITNELTFEQCKELAKSLRGVIVGSDQVLRLDLIRGFFNKYLLNFATKDNQKIAMSASFGMDKNTYLAKQKPTKEELKMMKNSLMSFDYLSSREFEGVEIFKDFFGLDADMILDPVFLLDKNKYIELANESKIDIGDNLFSYILKTKDEYKEVKEYLCKKTNLPLLELDRFSTQNAQDWLKGIINSKLIITDSFHCVCFAMIFNKPFICVDNNVGASARFNSLFKLVGVPNSLISKLSDVYNMELPFDMSFEKINEILSTEKERCLTIFEKVLKEGYSNNPQKESVLPFKYGKLKWYNKYFKYLKCKYFSQLLKGKKKISYKEKATFRKKELEWNK